ncbi:MAG: inositol monophosphatase [Acidimicrobiia bacterium]|nr:inositol monophosphatase [Acidimicrobiia bacterium]
MDDLSVALEAAQAGAAIIREHFGSPPIPEYKTQFDPVTAVDLAAEKAIIAVLAAHRPNDAVLAEEGGGILLEGRQWIVDPLDGTVNFVHSIPQVSVSIALYDGAKGLVGVVHDALRDEVFTASVGKGAHCNGEPISVSSTVDISRAVVATGFPYDHDLHADSLSVVVREMLRKVNGLRRFGSAALDLAWTAAGRFDAYWELGIAPWDGAAGMVLVREAGGSVTDPFGAESVPSNPLVVASNGMLHEAIRTIVDDFCPPHLRPS